MNLRSAGSGLRVAVLAGALIAQGALAQVPSTPTEYEVQAAYLSRFGSFVQWPDDMPGQEPFTICVLGVDPFGPALDAAIEGQTIGGRPLTVRRIVQARESQGCRILFISASEEPALDDILTTLGTSSTLTVSDIPRFAVRGGMLGFTIVGDNVRFEVSEARAERAALMLSSQLLRLAVNVRP